MAVIAAQLVQAVVHQHDSTGLVVVTVNKRRGNLLPTQRLRRLPGVVASQHHAGGALHHDRPILAMLTEAFFDGVDPATARVARVRADAMDWYRQRAQAFRDHRAVTGFWGVRSPERW